MTGNGGTPSVLWQYVCKHARQQNRGKRSSIVTRGRGLPLGVALYGAD